MTPWKGLAKYLDSLVVTAYKQNAAKRLATQGFNKMGNPSNGPAAATYLNMFCLDGYNIYICKMVTCGHTWSLVVTPGQR